MLGSKIFVVFNQRQSVENNHLRLVRLHFLKFNLIILININHKINFLSSLINDNQLKIIIYG
jgi:hypothetical protein